MEPELSEPALFAQSQSHQHILLEARAVYHNELGGWLRSLRLFGQPDDDAGTKSYRGAWRDNSAIGCGSCGRNEPAAELHVKTGAAERKWRRYSAYESYGVVVRGMGSLVQFVGLPHSASATRSRFHGPPQPLE